VKEKAPEHSGAFFVYREPATAPCQDTVVGLATIMTIPMGLLSRAFNGCGRLLESASRFCLYTTAALTPLATMREGVSPAWNEFAADEHDIRVGLIWWERVVADQYVKRGDRVLVIGCGSGRDVVAFLERGCVVTGIDPAEGALTRARNYLKKRGWDATLECGFFEDWHAEQEFDVVWFSWFVYGYVLDSKRRIQMLKQAARNVSPNGFLVLSYPTNPPRSRAAALVRFTQRVWRNDWALEDGDVIGRVAGSGVLTYEHRFTRAQIEQETRAAGFHPVLVAEPPIVVLRRA
jgi:SAM-dependent methyltransferase